MNNTRHSMGVWSNTTKLSRLFGTLVFGVIVSGTGLLEAQLINVDFNQNNGVNWGGGGPNPGPSTAPWTPNSAQLLLWTASFVPGDAASRVFACQWQELWIFNGTKPCARLCQNVTNVRKVCLIQDEVGS
jgi:hypothetical protein